MNSSRKRVFLSLGLLAAGAAAIFLFLGIFIHAKKTEVERELHNLLGNDVTFKSVDPHIWGGIGFSVTELRIADSPEFAATPFVYARELRLGLSLWHLFLGRLVINSLRFNQPEFQIITNEGGLLNVSALANRKKELSAFPRLRAGSTEGKEAPVNFLITRLKVVQGRVDLIDRSVDAPAELQIKNVALDIGWLDVTTRAKIKLTAAVTEGLGQDVRIEGEMGPPTLGKAWSQQPINLQVQVDSLYLPMLARAVPFFRDRIPRELDITGPMYFQAKLAGTFQRPRISGMVLKIPFLGSSDYNAILEGKAEFTASRRWAEALIAGKLTLTSISLSELRKVPLLQRTLPLGLAADGSMNVFSRFEGTWNQLRVGALLDANKSDFQYPDWFHKPAGEAATLRAQALRDKGNFVLYPSELSLGEAKILVSGTLGGEREPRLSVRVNTGRSSLKIFEPLLAPAAFKDFAGDVDLNLLLEKNLESPASEWHAHGVLRLAKIALHHKVSGTKIDRLTGSVSFSGRGARAPAVSFYLGSSAVSLALDIDDFNPLRARYTMRSTELNVADIPLRAAGATGRMKNFSSSGKVTLENESPHLQGNILSPEGTLHEIPYRNLQTEVVWSPGDSRIENLRAAVFAGEMRAGGFWSFTSEHAGAFRLAPRLHGMSLSAALARLAPDFGKQADGQLDFRGEFGADVPPRGTLWPALKGSGDASIRNGTLRDFNLIANLFYRGGSQAAQSTPETLAAALKRGNTPIEDFSATLSVETQRVRSDNLSITTPEYAITGVGWVDFDGTTQWKGLLVFSPTVTRELQREYGAIRYFLDRKGRFAISFRVDGKLPNVRVRPENRALAQAFRWGTWQRGDDVTGAEGRGEKKWLPDSLERLLHR